MRRDIQISYSIEIDETHYILAIHDLIKDGDSFPTINEMKAHVKYLFKVFGTEWVANNILKEYNFSEEESAQIRRILKTNK